MKSVFSRRAFVAGAPGALAAAPMIADTVAKGIASGSLNGLVGSGFIGEMPMQANAAKIAPGQTLFDNPAVQALRKQMRRQGRARQIRQNARSLSGGFDPDLAMLRSPSLGARVRIQSERDKRQEAQARSFTRLMSEKITEIAKGLGLSDYPTPYIEGGYDVEDEE